MVGTPYLGNRINSRLGPAVLCDLLGGLVALQALDNSEPDVGADLQPESLGGGRLLYVLINCDSGVVADPLGIGPDDEADDHGPDP
jgi:hypothetical protein